MASLEKGRLFRLTPKLASLFLARMLLKSGAGSRVACFRDIRGFARKREAVSAHAETSLPFSRSHAFKVGRGEQSCLFSGHTWLRLEKGRLVSAHAETCLPFSRSHAFLKSAGAGSRVACFRNIRGFARKREAVSAHAETSLPFSRSHAFKVGRGEQSCLFSGHTWLRSKKGGCFGSRRNKPPFFSLACFKVTDPTNQLR